MAELKFFRGESERIGEGETPIEDGCFYLCIDNGKLYVDAVDGAVSKRFCVSGVSEYQGLENSGKLLGVDNTGNVSTTEIFMPTGRFTWRSVLSRYTWRDLYEQKT